MIKIAVATHREYEMPEDECYLPLWVGAAISDEGCAKGRYRRDDDGDSISEKNPYYSELTGTYWMWKNCDAEYKGLVHYRRIFGREQRAFALKQYEEMLMDVDILLPKPRNYHIETNYSHYAHAHDGRVMDETRRIIEEQTPEYAVVFDAVMKRTGGHRFNMMVMRRELFDEYCSWLFGILFELEHRLDELPSYELEPRILGHISERLVDVWLEKSGYRYRDIPYWNVEGENVLLKGIGLVGRKITGNK